MMEWKGVMTALVMLALTTTPVLSDTPANCTYDDIQGTWNLYETERSGDATIDCDNMGDKSIFIDHESQFFGNVFCVCTLAAKS